MKEIAKLQVVENESQQIDLVCLMKVDTENCKFIFNYSNENYYFCCQHCLEKFKLDPAKYINRNHSEITTEVNNTSFNTHSKFYCPMHTEIVSDKINNCPKCGMLLESVGSDQGNAVYNLKRFKFCLIATIPMLVIDIICHVSNVNKSSINLLTFIQLVLASGVLWSQGLSVIKLGLDSIKNKNLNMYTLLGTGIIIPYLIGLLGLVGNIFFINPGLKANNYMLTNYLLTCVLVTTIYWLGQYLEALAISYSQSEIINLKTFLPSYVTRILPDMVEERVKIEDIQVGNIIKIKPNEKIPCDGVIIEGNTIIDESLLSGESIPVIKNEKSNVYCGSINGNGLITIEVRELSSNSFLAQIFALIEQAKHSQMPVQKLVDKISGIFIKTVFVFDTVSLIYNILNKFDFNYAIIHFINVLVIACPCALGLATPIAVLVTSGIAAKFGVLFNNINSLETLTKIDTIIFDKTGTLTNGEFKITNCQLLGKLSENEIFTLAASLEQNINHPIAYAVVKEAQKRNLELQQAENTINYPGLGIKGSITDKSICIGNLNFLESENVKNTIDNAAKNNSAHDSTSLYVAINGNLEAIIYLNDSIKDSAPSTIDELKKLHIDVVLASGDNANAVKSIAQKLNISDFKANLKPGEKHALIKQYKANNHIVAMVGDGINDAPALVLADVSLAIGDGSTLAKQSANIILVNDNLKNIIKCIKLSKAMLNNIKINLGLAFAYNIIALPLASGLLDPVLHFHLNPMTSCLAMSLSSILVIANANTLKLRA